MRPKEGGHAADDQDEDVVEKVIKQVGCSKLYYKLEDCLGENDRDWRKCQEGRPWHLSLPPSPFVPTPTHLSLERRESSVCV